MTFKFSGRIKRKYPPARCKGKPRITRWGVFVGTIKFRGEHRYTEVNASRAKGTVHTSPRWKCKRGNGPHSPQAIEGEQEPSFVLDARSSRDKISFSALATRPPEERGVTLFAAESFERRGKMRVTRSALVFDRERGFVFDDALGSATLEPSPPFSGSATFARSPGEPPSWDGSLRVDLPGRTLALAGDSFRARLYRQTPDAIAVGSQFRRAIEAAP